ncbi:lipocalin-like domain-containing protein [Dyadobacter sediminis]|uniref:Lipocalin family protein n=1 Tax=Dyadobacter sediminis TaxID=1493691 RepID=A0A5R9KAJ0_9BACT|nr:lipocalin family protein [Dyadobacter sediminis]TLU91744.1 lipocalin family protein [Dyadobacter sediminis]
MKKYIPVLIVLFCILQACNKESGSISGNWVTEMPGQPQHKYGFSLKDDGNASSINMKNLNYEKWEKQGDLLILKGSNPENKQSSGITERLKIISVADSTLILEKPDGKRVKYVKTAEVEKVVNNFEIYECFAYINKKDSAFMHLNVADSIVTGDLVYMFFEKDKNQGKIIGKMRGDTLLAKYHFISEGVLSTRDVVFLKNSSTWTEGFGETEEKAGSTAFRDRTKISFKKGLPFKGIPCK